MRSDASGAPARRYRLAAAAGPLAAALAALALVAAGSFSRQSALPALVEPYAYGFFLDRYPLFAFGLVYGLARILAAASIPGATPARRWILGGLGLVPLLALSLYPTFGGLVLRGGFMAGGGAFLSGQPLNVAYAIGAAVAALVFGLAIGLPTALGRLRFRRVGLAARARAAAVTAAASFLALWFAAALLGLARDAGIGPWPARPFTAGEALRAGLLFLAAALPHVLVTALRRPDPTDSVTGPSRR